MRLKTSTLDRAEVLVGAALVALVLYMVGGCVSTPYKSYMHTYRSNQFTQCERSSSHILDADERQIAIERCTKD